MKINLKDFLEAGILGKLRLILNDQEAKKVYLSMIAPQLALVVIVATMGWKSLLVLSATLIISFYLPVLVMNTILNNLLKTAFMTNPQKQQAAFQKESSTSSVMKKASQLFGKNRQDIQQQSETQQQAIKKQVEVDQVQQQVKTSEEIKDIVNQVELLRKELSTKDNLEEKVKKLEEQTYSQRRPSPEERPRRMTLEERKERRARRIARRGEIQVDQPQ